jgi:hypothetical protein
MRGSRSWTAAVTAALAACTVIAWSSRTLAAELTEPVTIQVFESNDIHYSLEEPDRYATESVSVTDNGRVIVRTVSLPEPREPVRIVATLVVKPVPLDERIVYDTYDRAGNVRVSKEGMPDIEIVRFITPFGGETRHEVDVSALAALLRGECVLKGFVDTWLSPAWRMDLSLTYTPAPEQTNPDWVRGLAYEEWVTSEMLQSEPLTAEISVPRDLDRFVLDYLATGHCTDGKGPDEFETKDNVISIDGAEVHRSRPWRDDCLAFRPVNPYCARWSDGTWSSDYGRSGWCPGDIVRPEQIDVTENLGPGHHTISFDVVGIRPRDQKGYHGYWRISAYLLGWRD